MKESQVPYDGISMRFSSWNFTLLRSKMGPVYLGDQLRKKNWKNVKQTMVVQSFSLDWRSYILGPELTELRPQSSSYGCPWSLQTPPTEWIWSSKTWFSEGLHYRRSSVRLPCPPAVHGTSPADVLHRRAELTLLGREIFSGVISSCLVTSILIKFLAWIGTRSKFRQ